MSHREMFALVAVAALPADVLGGVAVRAAARAALVASRGEQGGANTLLENRESSDATAIQACRDAPRRVAAHVHAFRGGAAAPELSAQISAVSKQSRLCARCCLYLSSSLCILTLQYLFSVLLASHIRLQLIFDKLLDI